MTILSDIRIPPQDITAEQSVVGAMLTEFKAIVTASTILSSSDFYSTINRIIFDGIVELHNQNKPVDFLTFPSFMKNKGELDNIGGEQYIAECMAKSPTASAVKYYAEIVKDKSIKRAIIKLTDKMMNRAYAVNEKSTDLIESLEKECWRI